MNPSILAACLLFCAGPAWSAGYSELLAQAKLKARAHYLSHDDKKKDKTLDQAVPLPPPPAGDARAAKEHAALQAVFLEAREVQLGCKRPCTAAAEVALYQEKVKLVATRLGLESPGLRDAHRRYFQEEKPRLREASDSGQSAAAHRLEAEALANLLEDPRLPTQTRDTLNQRLAAIAERLGKTNYLQADGGDGAVYVTGQVRKQTSQQIVRSTGNIPRTQTTVSGDLATKPPPAPLTGTQQTATKTAPQPPPAPLSPKARACVDSLQDHPSLAKMCVDHPNYGPTWAPLLAGLLDAVKEQFGTLTGIITNILFLLFGLLMSVATGGVALILKLIALIAAGWAIWKLIASLGKAVARADMRQIGKVGGSLLIMIVMALVGFGIGKTKVGGNAIKSMQTGLTAALDKIGVTGLMGKVNAMLPAPMLAAMEKIVGKAPPDRSSAQDAKTPKQGVSAKTLAASESSAAMRAQVSKPIVRTYGTGIVGQCQRISGKLQGTRDTVAQEMKGLLTRVMGKSDGKMTAAEFNRMFNVLTAYAKRHGIEVNPGGHWARELFLKGRSMGLYPKSATMMDTVGFGTIKLGKSVGPTKLHELAHMFHTIQMRVTLKRAGVVGAEAEKFLKLMENGGNYLELEKAATAIGSPLHKVIPGSTGSARYLDKVSDLIDATNSSLGATKVRVPGGWSIEQMYAWTISRAPIVLGKSVKEMLFTRMSFIAFISLYYNNPDISQLPGLAPTDPEVLKRMGKDQGPMGFRDLINGAVFGEKKG